MPAGAETKSGLAAMETELSSPEKKSSNSSTSKAALARVSLLDGSALDVTVDRKTKGRDLLNSICAGLNILEKDYFGLIYQDSTDDRNWLNLDRPVAKFFHSDPWVLQFAVKFYPPEPSQLHEDITRYQLCLQIRNDILEQRLPCTFVTQALLGSYLVQSELGDYDPKTMPDARYLKDFKIAPNQNSELEQKVMDLHKNHKGQSPAEAELHYLENAKKLAMYGVDLHPAKDSEGVDIMLGVCASGLLVHRDKLRINRFAWPKILKISYKRHNFYIKIRPGDFEQYESTIGFKLDSHKAAKKLWKSCVEHHTFFRLMTPETTAKSSMFPRFGSKFRYSGKTMYETKKNLVKRAAPKFERSLSGRRLTSRSMDALAVAEREREEDAQKRHSLGHSSDPYTDLSPTRNRSPMKKDKKEKVRPEDNDKENNDKDRKSEKFSILPNRASGKEKSAKDVVQLASPYTKELKEKLDKAEKEKVGVLGSPNEQGHTKPYEYQEEHPSRNSFTPVGLPYDKKQNKNASPTKEKEKKERSQPVTAGSAAPLIDARGNSYSPNEGVAGNKPGRIGDPTTAFLEAERYAKGAPIADDGLDNVAMPATGIPNKPAANPNKKKVKIMVITSRFDPSSKRYQTENGEIEHSTGTMDVETGRIESKYGLIDPKKGTLEAPNTKTGKKEIHQGKVDSKTGHLHLIKEVPDSKSGRADDTLYQIICVTPHDNPVVELTAITSRIDPTTKKLDIMDGELERSLGILNPEDGILYTKYGEISSKTNEIKVSDPKTQKVIASNNIKVDPATGQITIFRVPDPKSGKINPNVGRLIQVVRQIDPVVQVISVAGKYDSKKGIIDPQTAQLDTSTGQFNPKAGKIDTKYGQIDLVKHTITCTDPKTGKPSVKDVKIDTATGQILLTNQINPKTNKPDKDHTRILSLRVVQHSVDPKNPLSAIEISDKDVIVDPKTNQIWVPSGGRDAKTNKLHYVSGRVDPLTGNAMTIEGYLDPKTNEIKQQTKIDPNSTKIEPSTNKILTATGEVDRQTGEPLYFDTQYDPENGWTYTKECRIDPKTGKIIIIKILLIVKGDCPEEFDPESLEIDPKTGRILKFSNKPVYIYKMIDPKTGDIIQVDPNDPRISGARTTVIHRMTLTGKIDPITGRIKSEYGDIDQTTGDIDPDTAVMDPVTGKYIFNYADIDPTHFGKDVEVSTTTESVPITRQQFFDGIRDIGKNALRRDSETSSLGDMTDKYATEYIKEMPSPPKNVRGEKVDKYSYTPTVVKTTTKQILTKNEDGLTHNVEEEVQNLDTGVVTYSTQEHKADPQRDDLSGAYVTATAVTTRTATTHEDLGKKAKTEQLEEKTVATTRSHDPTKQQQRVVTQEVKTTATVTSGDQFQRRGSISSISSGDSGTPIDVGYDGSVVKTATVSQQSPTSPGPRVSQTRVILGEETHGYSGVGEIVSSQTVSSKTRTVETITYKTERDGIVETRVEQKITIQSDGDPIDHDKALAEAIQEATAMNPDMTVEKIEIQQQTQ